MPFLGAQPFLAGRPSQLMPATMTGDKPKAHTCGEAVVDVVSLKAHDTARIGTEVSDIFAPLLLLQNRMR